MSVVSVINYKGGVGKTTIAANLAAELGWRGNNVLLIDLDPQASLTFSFLEVDEWQSLYANSNTIRNWYDAFIDADQDTQLTNLIITPPDVNQHIDGQVDLICSHIALINVDLELATRLGGATLRQSKTNYLRVHSRLRDGLEESSIADQYDYVLIDCPPNFNIVTKTAIVASDRILIPTIPDYLSTLGIEQLSRHVSELVRDFNEYVAASGGSGSYINPSILGVVLTMLRNYSGQPIQAQASYIDTIRELGIHVFESFVRRNDTMHADAREDGMPVVLRTVHGQTYLSVRNELEALTSEFVDRLQGGRNASQQ